MSTLETILYLSIYLLYTTKCQLNEYVQETGPNGEDIWRSTSDFIPVRSQSFGSIRLGQIMSMEFDFTFWGRTNSPRTGKYEMFFRVGYDANDGSSCQGEGARYPSFWLTNTQNTMHVSVSSGTSCQPVHSLNDYGLITIGDTYHIKIQFNNTQLYVSVTGGNKPDWNHTWPKQPIPKTYLGDTVPIWWMSNKFQGTGYNIGNGTFRNITLKSTIFTMPPTSAPTHSPTTAIPTHVTKYPTYNTYGPTASPIPEGIISEKTTVAAAADIIGDGGDKQSVDSGGMDGTLVGVITAVIAVSCCLLCGVVILCKNKNSKTHKKSYETDNGHGHGHGGIRTEMRHVPVPSHTLNFSPHDLQSPEEVGVIIKCSPVAGEDYYNDIGSGVYTPDGVLKTQIIPLDHGHEEYLSPAQKHVLYTTPKGQDNQNYNEQKNKNLNKKKHGNVNDNYQNGYLSKAQREEMLKHKKKTRRGSVNNSNSAHSNEALTMDNDNVSDSDDETSDDEVIEAMQTAGYVGNASIDQNNNNNTNNNNNNTHTNENDSLSDMSDAIEKNLTIGASGINISDSASELNEYEHDSLSELNETDELNNNLVTMQ